MQSLSLSVFSAASDRDKPDGRLAQTRRRTPCLSLVLVLMRNGNAYFNVHTQLNPGGEIRGQIVRR
jgi:hypothetical protein